MHWTNSEKHYGLVTITLHWFTAAVMIGLFALGLWMVELTYYDKWYNAAPALHKSVGILLFFVMLFRYIWRQMNPSPTPIGSPLEQRLAGLVHGLQYLLLFATLVAGYLISTADGKGIMVFDWFMVPATLSGYENQEDIAGEIHLWLAWLLILVSSGHTLAALKDHFLNRVATLRRMLRTAQSE